MKITKMKDGVEVEIEILAPSEAELEEHGFSGSDADIICRDDIFLIEHH